MDDAALKDFRRHKEIHEEISGGAQEQSDVMKTLLNKLEHKELADEMQSFIDYVEENLLQHGEIEEAEGGLYDSAVGQNPELGERVRKLTRDHELIRVMVDRMKEELAKDDVDFQKLIDHSVSIILVDEIHSRDEEELLMGGK